MVLVLEKKKMMEKEIDKFSLLFFLRRVNANALRVVPCYIK